MATRGLRNNNPLNIRRSGSNKWQGMRPVQTDKAFVQFTARKYGYRAAFVLIRNYIQRHHANTIGKIIARWAPSSDGNDTQSYIRFVSRTTGIPADEPLRFENQQVHYRDYVASHPTYELVKIYADEGITGTSTNSFSKSDEDIFLISLTFIVFTTFGFSS